MATIGGAVKRPSVPSLSNLGISTGVQEEAHARIKTLGARKAQRSLSSVVGRVRVRARAEEEAQTLGFTSGRGNVKGSAMHVAFTVNGVYVCARSQQLSEKGGVPFEGGVVQRHCQLYL